MNIGSITTSMLWKRYGCSLSTTVTYWVWWQTQIRIMHGWNLKRFFGLQTFYLMVNAVDSVHCFNCVKHWYSVMISGRGKGGTVKRKANSRSSRAGLQFLVVPDGTIVCWKKEIMSNESAPEHQSSLRPLWSIWPPTTKRLLSFQDICKPSSRTTRNWTIYFPELLGCSWNFI